MTKAARVHSEAASGHHLKEETNSKRPKIHAKGPKRPPFLRLRELKCIKMDWKSSSTPF